MSGGIEAFRQSLIETYNQNKELPKEKLVQRLVDVAATNDIKNGTQEITEEEIKVLDDFIEKNLGGKFDIKAGSSEAKWELELEETLPDNVSKEIKGEKELFDRLDKTINQMKKHNQLPKELEGKSPQEIRDLLMRNREIREKFQKGLEKTLRKEGFDKDEAESIAKRLTYDFIQRASKKTSTQTTFKESEVVKSDHTTTEVQDNKDKDLKLQNKETVVKISQDQPYLDLARDRRNWDRAPTAQQNISDFNFYQRSELGRLAGATGKDLSEEFPNAESLIAHMERNPEDFDRFAKMTPDEKRQVAERIVKYYTTGNFKIEDFQRDMAAISTKLAKQLDENGGIDNKKGYATTLTMRYFSAMIANTPRVETRNYHIEGQVKTKQSQTIVEEQYNRPNIQLDAPKKKTPKKAKPLEFSISVPKFQKEWKSVCMGGQMVNVPTVKLRSREVGRVQIGAGLAENINQRRKEKAERYNQEQENRQLQKEKILENNFGLGDEQVSVRGIKRK
ncbi:MAG: hypothetical protein KatS3mg068_2428 [Candidatus Sericytochromatia bacterium]|nr:MAG: hypothetical protein KatS3mg068_2428 [Candidatus Sericytochromatia bacterium]